MPFDSSQRMQIENYILYSTAAKDENDQLLGDIRKLSYKIHNELKSKSTATSYP